MGKNKLRRFAENKKLSNVIQPTRDEALTGFQLKGNWRKDFFKNLTLRRLKYNISLY